MARVIVAAGILGSLVCAGGAQAESGGFFKSLFTGGSDRADTEQPASSGARIYDPSDPYCPPVTVVEGASAVRSYAGEAGDNAHLRHQITFGQLSRECSLREDGSISVKVGSEVRALLGPAGMPGRFEAPITFAIQYNDAVLMARSHRLSVVVARDAVQGTASMIETDLTVPKDRAIGYAITVGLRPGAPKPAAQAARRTARPADASPANGHARTQ